VSSHRCASCAVCKAGEWITASCQGYTNTNCAPCGTCGTGQHMVAGTECSGKTTTDTHVCRNDGY
jgi:hypothetical protein